MFFAADGGVKKHEIKHAESNMKRQRLDELNMNKGQTDIQKVSKPPNPPPELHQSSSLSQDPFSQHSSELNVEPQKYLDCSA